MAFDKKHAAQWFQQLQSNIIAGLEQLEAEYGDSSAKFQPKTWQRCDKHHPTDAKSSGGGGTMAVLRGKLFEKAGVNFSEVQGHFSEKFRKEIPGAAEDGKFWASGISLVIHPTSPHVPIIHMNTRMITTQKQWFGGGIDLTPALPEATETKTFHHQLEESCNRYNLEYYPRFKKRCDEYFFLPHRDEARGVGGIFYDNLDSGDLEQDFAFTQTIGALFLEVYRPIVEAKARLEWNAAEEKAEGLKRSRYVEFNLLLDRGTRFGIMTGGNTEAILMSLPPRTGWL